MTSQIDPSKPATGMAFTSDMRANFYAAYNEISTLQQAVEDLGGGIDLSDIQAQIDAIKADVDRLKARHQVAASVLTVDPPNTSSAVFVTAGLGLSVTPRSARTIVSAQGQLGNTQNGQPSEVQLCYGSGTPPAFGTPVASTNGELIGGFAAMLSAKPNDYTPFAIAALIEDLVIGSPYWLGIGFRSAGGTATLSQMTLVAFEVLDPLVP